MVYRETTDATKSAFRGKSSGGQADMPSACHHSTRYQVSVVVGSTLREITIHGWAVSVRPISAVVLDVIPLLDSVLRCPCRQCALRCNAT